MITPLHRFTLLLCLLLPTLLGAQTYEGTKAAQKIPGTDIIRLAGKQQRPQYLHFDSAGPAVKSASAYFADALQVDANESLVEVAAATDAQGFTHTRYQQRYHGHRVIGGVYVAHARGGQVQSMGGELYDRFAGKTTPEITPAAALQLALTELPARKYAWEAAANSLHHGRVNAPEPELVWVPKNLDFTAEFQLAYEVTVHGLSPLFRERLYLSAADGSLLARINLLHETEEPASHDHAEHTLPATDEPGTAVTTLSGERAIVADRQANGQFRLLDNARGVHTVNGRNFEEPTALIDFLDDDNYWNNVNTTQDEVATDVHWAAEQYYDLLQSMGRNSIDNEGGDLIAFVHLGQSEGNAYWDGYASYYGDGSPGSTLDRPVVSVDVVGHEFTHGLVDYTANLIYAGESGALNESFADIFGYRTSVFARGAAQSYWTIGQEATSSGRGIRSFITPNDYNHPANYGGNLWFPGSGVHTNSSVQNHWFYLLTVGDEGMNDFGQSYTVNGVGLDTAFAIAYRTLSVYLTESSDYADAAFYSLRAAEDLYGACSDVYREVNNAWYAVGLANEISETFTADFSARRTYCDLPAEVRFTNQSGRLTAAEWDFGDGQTSTEINPAHIYTAQGDYTVTLIATGCEGEMDTVTFTDYISIDPESTSCDTTRMDVEEAILLTECEGIITDSGGPEGPYSDDESSIVTLRAPTSGTIILEFSQFELESGYDYLRFYSGTAEEVEYIAQYTGSQLAGQTLEFDVSPLTIELSTDGSVIREGFVCNYRVDDGGQLARADFSLSNEALAFNELLELTTTEATVGLVDYYDMGDGTLLVSGATAHRYASAGTFTITQYVTACSGADTTARTVVVTEPGRIQVSPERIDVTLNEGDSTTQLITVSNDGVGPLLYQVTPNEVIGGPATTREPDANGFSEFEVPILPTDSTLILEFGISGSDAYLSRGAEVYLDGFFPTIINAQSASSEGYRVEYYEVPFHLLEEFRQDGAVPLVISSLSNIQNDTVPVRHRVRRVYPATDFVSGDGSMGFTSLPAGATAQTLVTIRSAGLLGGSYTTDIIVNSTDTANAAVIIPVSLTVIGQPRLAAIPDSVNFGQSYVGVLDSARVILENAGTDVLTITDITLADAANLELVGYGDLPIVLAIGERDTLQLYHEPTEVGELAALLEVNSNGGTVLVPITATVDLPGAIGLNPDTLRFVVSDGATAPETLTVSNSGPGQLSWSLEVDAVKEVVLWTGRTVFEQETSLRAALADIPGAISLTEVSVFEGPAIAEALVEKDVFIIPDNEYIFTEPTIRQAVLDFVNRGGSLIILNQAYFLTDLDFGDYVPEFVASTELQMILPDHPLAAGFSLPYELQPASAVMSGGPTPPAPPFTAIISGNQGPWLSAANYGQGSVVYLGSAFYPEGDPIRQLLYNALAYGTGSVGASLLTLSPASGTVAPGEQTDVTATLNDASSLPAGQTSLNLVGSSSDPRQPRLSHPVVIEVRRTPTAVIDVDNSRVCDRRIIFTNRGENNPQSFTWNFGDGSTSTEANPNHRYAADGTYEVSLEVCNEVGCSSTSTSVVVESTAAACSLFEMTTNLDQITERCSGTVTDNGGATGNYSNNIRSNLTIAPSDVEAITFDIKQFELESNYDYLYFYAGTPDTGRLIARYSGQDLAVGRQLTIYEPMVTLRFTTDGSVTRSGFEIEWFCGVPQLQASFEMQPDVDCENRMSFASTTNVPDAAITWLFSTGQVSVLDELSMDFFTPGLHTVTMTATTDSDTSSISQEFEIAMPYNLVINAPDTVLTGQPFRVDYLANANLDFVTWNLSNIRTTNEPSPVHGYSTPGTYTVTLTATSFDGCVMEVAKEVVALLSVSTSYVGDGVDYRLYPNPVADVANLTLTQPAGGGVTMVRLLDATGRRVLEQRFAATPRLETQLPVGELAAGIYVVQVVNQQGLLVTDRLIVK